MAQIVDISSNYELVLFGPDKMAAVAADDALVNLAPPVASEFNIVQWEQPENGYGLLSLRGVDGAPPVTGVPGYRRLSMAPGYYGEKVLISEYEMNTSRDPGSPNDPMDMKKRIGYIQEQILKRAFDRMRYINSMLFRTGKFLVSDATGSITHADTLTGYAASNVFAPAVGWHTNPSTATPIDDMLGWKATLQLSTDAWFDKRATMLMNTPSFNDLQSTNQIRNQIRLDNNATVAGLSKVNELLKTYDLPQIEVYDENYYPTKADASNRTNATYFMPSQSAIWKGVRKDGAMPAQFQLTRSAIKNPPAGIAQNAPGANWSPPQGRLPMADEFAKALYTIINFQFVPPQYEIDVGFNGGPAVPFATCFAGVSWT